MTEHIDGYDELTVDEVRDAVEEADLSPSQLEEVREYEEENKSRVTVLDWLADRIERTEPETPDRLVVTRPRPGYESGIWFDRGWEHKGVEYSTRVQRAIDNGDLRLVRELYE